jgi:hypothetical protein
MDMTSPLAIPLRIPPRFVREGRRSFRLRESFATIANFDRGTDARLPIEFRGQARDNLRRPDEAAIRQRQFAIAARREGFRMLYRRHTDMTVVM